MAGRKLEQLHSPMFRGQPTFPTSDAPTGAAWCGITTIVSGDASVVVSTSLVTSDSFIFGQVVSNTSPASGFGKPLEVKSIVDGVSFSFASADGEVMRDAATPIRWILVRPK